MMLQVDVACEDELCEQMWHWMVVPRPGSEDLDGPVSLGVVLLP